MLADVNRGIVMNSALFEADVVWCGLMFLDRICWWR